MSVPLPTTALMAPAAIPAARMARASSTAPRAGFEPAAYSLGGRLGLYTAVPASALIPQGYGEPARRDRLLPTPMAAACAAAVRYTRGGGWGPHLAHRW